MTELPRIESMSGFLEKIIVCIGKIIFQYRHKEENNVEGTLDDNILVALEFKISFTQDQIILL